MNETKTYKPGDRVLFLTWLKFKLPATYIRSEDVGNGKRSHIVETIHGRIQTPEFTISQLPEDWNEPEDLGVLDDEISFGDQVRIIDHPALIPEDFRGLVGTLTGYSDWDFKGQLAEIEVSGGKNVSVPRTLIRVFKPISKVDLSVVFEGTQPIETSET